MSDRYYIRNRFVEACRWTGDAMLSIDLNSGYEEHRPRLTIIVGRIFTTFRLPKWIVQPHRRKVSAAGSWDAAKVARMGRDWYWDETRREFGLSLAADHLRVKYGIQADSWPGDKTWSYYFPWMKWRAIEVRWLDLTGAIHERVPASNYEAWQAAKERAPSMRYTFNDFDGERIEATIRMEEFVHARGGWAWLERLLSPRVGQRYDIELDKETGPRKGSWKGGMLGCNGPALPGELHDAAFRRWAGEQYKVTAVVEGCVNDAPTTVIEHKLGNPRDLPEVPGPGGERWSQAPLGDTHPVASNAGVEGRKP